MKGRFFPQDFFSVNFFSGNFFSRTFLAVTDYFFNVIAFQNLH